MKKMFLISLLMLTITVGCTAKSNAGIEDKNGTQLMSNRRANNIDTTNETRGQTMSDQNPNLLNTDGGRNSIRSDVDKARDVINQTTEYQSESVWVNGNVMWVTVYKKGMMTNEQRIDAEAIVHALLVKALPRYKIEVRVLQDRT
jgi:hypothetical protein